MKHQQLGFLLLLLVVIATVTSYGQDPLGPRPKRARTAADYEARTLKEIAARESETGSPVADEDSRAAADKIIVNGDLRPSRVTATYAGRSRSLPQNKQRVLNRWARFYAGAPTHYTVPYKSELLFRAGGVKCWLAVNQDSVDKFKSEVKPGDSVELFLIRLGGYLKAGKWEALALVESFQKIK